MGQCCSSSNMQDDDVELSRQPRTNGIQNTQGSSAPANSRPSNLTAPSSYHPRFSTAGATEESTTQRSTTGHRPSTSSGLVHVPDWDWERESSSDPSAGRSSDPSDPIRDRPESTATTHDLRYALTHALSGRPPDGHTGSQVEGQREHRGRPEDIQFGGRPPREHAPSRNTHRREQGLAEESTVPWPTGQREADD